VQKLFVYKEMFGALIGFGYTKLPLVKTMTKKY